MEFLLNWGRESFLVLAVAAVPAAAAWAILVSRRTGGTSLRRAIASATIDVGFVMSLVTILFVGLRPGPGIPGGWEQWNLIPFRDLAWAIEGRTWGLREALTGVIGNTLLFVPFGFFAALRFPTASWVGLACALLGLASAIEVGQAVMRTGRASDVTDIITNVIGGLVGIAVARLVVRLASVAHPTNG